MNTAIKIKNLSVTLGKAVQAVKSVDLELPEGRIIGVIGPSGAGKTTLIRSIVGRQRISSGSVMILGEPAGSANLRRQISYMPQEPSVYPDLTIWQNLDYFASMLGLESGAKKESISNILRDVDLAEHANRLISNLSGGQKQRVTLAITLIDSPKLMVLDEPTVGLDPVLREQIWTLFHKLVAKQQTTIIISSHVMEEAGRCDELVLIREGEILAHDSPTSFCQKTGVKTVEQGFLKLVEKR